MQVVIIGAGALEGYSPRALSCLAEGIRLLGLEAADTEVQIHYLGNSLREVQLEPLPLGVMHTMPDRFDQAVRDVCALPPLAIDVLRNLRLEDVLALKTRFEHLVPLEVESLKALLPVEVEAERPVKPEPFRGYMKRASRRRW